MYTVIMRVRFRGELVEWKLLVDAYMLAWEKREQEHLDRLLFRIPPDPRGFDMNKVLTNELVYRIFRMSREGRTRIDFHEAIERHGDACFDATGDLVTFEPLDEDIVKWAERHGYYIDFDQIEMVDDLARA